MKKGQGTRDEGQISRQGSAGDRVISNHQVICESVNIKVRRD